jgi:hypothetical protein
MSETELSAKSCASCRRLHRKCDRRLPCCSLCLERRKECVYETTKRGIKTQTENARPYPSVNPSTTTTTIGLSKQSPVQNNAVLEFLPLYSDLSITFMFDMPIFTREKLMDILRYLDAHRLGQAYLLPQPEWEDVSLVYAVQAYTFKMREQFDLAAQLFEASRTLVMKDFERVSVSFTLATCFAYLGLYCTYEDDVHRANFFFRNVKGYLDYQAVRSVYHPCHEFLEHIYVSAQCLLSEECDMERVVKNNISKLYAIQSHHRLQLGKTVPYNTSVLLLAETDLSGIDIDKIRLDLAENSNYHYTLDDERVARISLKYSSLFDRLTPQQIAESEIQGRRLNIMFCLEAVRLQRYITRGNADNARAISDYISRMTTNPFFLYCPAIVGPIVAMAANFHLQCLTKCKDMIDRGALLERLREELIALTSISDKIKCLRPQFTDLISNISKELNLGWTQPLDFAPITSLPPPVQTSYNFGNTMLNFATTIQDRGSSVVRGASNVASSASNLIYDELDTSLMFVDDVLSLDAVDDLFQDFIDY